MIQPVNVGAAAGDGTGDPLRTAFQKCNKPIQGYDFSAHKWADDDWQAAMADFAGFLSQNAIYDGSYSLGNGVSSGTVTGLNLAFTPARVLAVVRIPVGGLKLTVNVVDATLTADGFQFVLSAATDSANYSLDFLITQQKALIVPLGPDGSAPTVGGVAPAGPAGG